jgi:hypothetical protein
MRSRRSVDTSRCAASDDRFSGFEVENLAARTGYRPRDGGPREIGDRTAARIGSQPGGHAERITTELDWSDLVLPSSTIAQLRELEAKIRAEPSMTGDSGRSSRRRPGYKCLFHGPPGTGKTLAATLLGKGVNRDVYRIALSDVLIDTA